MKKPIFVFSAFVLALATLTNCNSPNRKNVEAQTEEEVNKNDVPKATEENAKKDYITDVDRFRKQIDDRITINKRTIADLKSKVNVQKSKATADYKRKINDLEQKNNEMKKRIDEYAADGKEKWDTFKNGFNHDMDELERSLNELTSNKK